MKQLEQQVKPVNKLEVIVLSDSDENEETCNSKPLLQETVLYSSSDVENKMELDADDLVDIIRVTITENQQIPQNITEHLISAGNSHVYLSMFERLTPDDICEMGRHLCDFDYPSALVFDFFKFLLLPIVS